MYLFCRTPWRHRNLQKSTKTQVFCLTWKCASRHSGVQFCDILTSKSRPRMQWFGHFDLKMCFAPKRRTIFRHLNFKKWFEAVSFLAFRLESALRATAAYHSLYLLWPHVSALAALASLFDPPDPRIIGKTQPSATFLTFRAVVSSFFWLCFSDLLFNCPYCRKLDF